MKHVDDFLNEAIFQNIMMKIIFTIIIQIITCNILIIPITLLLMLHKEQWIGVGLISNLIIVMLLSINELDRYQEYKTKLQKERDKDSLEGLKALLRK